MLRSRAIRLLMWAVALNLALQPLLLALPPNIVQVAYAAAKDAVADSILAQPVPSDEPHASSASVSVPFAGSDYSVSPIPIDPSPVNCTNGGTPNDPSDDRCALTESWVTDTRSDYDFTYQVPTCNGIFQFWPAEQDWVYPSFVPDSLYFLGPGFGQSRYMTLHIPLTRPTTIGEIYTWSDNINHVFVNTLTTYFLCDTNGNQVGHYIANYHTGGPFMLGGIMRNGGPFHNVKDIYIAIGTYYGNPVNQRFTHIVAQASDVTTQPLPDRA